MKTPRSVSGKELANKLTAFGYEPTRQRGSHLRLRTTQQGEHFLTVPQHDTLPIGTLNSILRDISNHFNLSKEEVIDKLFT
jgi:predicted RNA binding protein YcfA (HicA-like mRNA interferase family)